MNANPISCLTPDEQEILRLLSRGKSSNEIAEEMSIPLQTIERHVSQILQKLNVSDRVEAVVWAILTAVENGEGIALELNMDSLGG